MLRCPGINKITGSLQVKREDSTGEMRDKRGRISRLRERHVQSCKAMKRYDICEKEKGLFCLYFLLGDKDLGMTRTLDADADVKKKLLENHSVDCT